MLMAIMTLTVFLSALQGYRSSIAEIQHLFDLELQGQARLLVIAGSGHTVEPETYAISNQYAFQVWQDGSLLQRSSNTPMTAISNLDSGYQDTNFGSHRWRTYTWIDASQDRRTVTAERIDIRNVLAERIIMKSVVPVIVSLPVAGLLIWLVVGYGLAPLRNLAAHLGSRRAEDLKPIPETRQPVELMQVITSTNDLFSRLEASFSREKRFAADAAHELRTPISALKVHLHNMSKNVSPGDHDLVQLEAATDRMGSVVEQILALHRTAPDQYVARFREVDLYQLVQQVIITMYSEFERRDIQLELTGERALLSGDRFALETLVKNLLGNACKYTPLGGDVLLSVEMTDAGVRLQVEDSGPGVSEELYQRIFDRFYRAGGDRHQSGVVGCGLGLAIVRHIADIHGASIELGESSFESGLCVSVWFPAIVDRESG
jgi:two-component system sensor histidine kinase QseC